MARNLSEGELRILHMIQAHYGPQNSVKDAFWASGDQAVLLVKSRDGSRTFMVNLTNLATWRADGTIASDEDLRREWLRIEGPSGGE
jgi:hypothetical protein